MRGLCLVAAALLLVVPPAQAQDLLEADLLVGVDIPLQDFVEVDAPDPGAPGPHTHSCADHPHADGPYLKVAEVAGQQHLVFAEGADEQGCAEARFEVGWPTTAGNATLPTGFTLSFRADRSVQSLATGTVPRAEQGVRFYAADEDDSLDDPGLEELHCFGHQPTFKAESVDADAKEESRVFELSKCADDLLAKRLVIAFYFLDAALPNDASGVPSFSPGPAWQAFSARITHVRVDFTGATIPLEMSIIDGLDPSHRFFGYLEAALDVPVPNAGQQHAIDFRLSNEFSIRGVYKVNDGALDPLGDDSIEAEEGNGTLRFHLGESLITEEEPGTYIVTFTGDVASQIRPARLPFVGLALLAPLVAGLFAQRNLNHLYHTARGRLRRLRWGLQTALVAAWLVYIGVASTLLVSNAGLGMAAYPVPAANVRAYAFLALTLLVMVVAGFIARRREMTLVLNDYNELERVQAEIERSNKELEQFAYVASHDLKEPLRMVAGYTQLLEMRYGKDLDRQGKEFLGFAAEGAQRLQRMVDDLLAYSRVRSDQSTFEEVSLEEVMAIVQGHLRGLIKDRGVRIEYGDLPIIYGDKGQLVQVLLNLVQNAVKFSPQDDPLVEVTAQRDGDHHMISVRDQGIGIEREQQERIFQIFQRLHLREDYEGNGIGLAMCKKIAEQMGGRISVASEAGKGSTFTIALPDLRPVIKPAAVRHVADSPS